MTIVLIDYGSGNLRSCAKAFEHCANGEEIIVSDSPQSLAGATHIVLPGVGAFADCMAGLSRISGLRAALEKEVIENKKLFLGICVGMQLMMQWGNEHGRHEGLGWMEGEVVPIQVKPPLKVPHMGWNELTLAGTSHPLFEGISTGDHAYFVHSYHAQCARPDDVLAGTDYGAQLLTAAIARENMMGTQFHPEKSQAVGLRLIENFVRMNRSGRE